MNRWSGQHWELKVKRPEVFGRAVLYTGPAMNLPTTWGSADQASFKTSHDFCRAPDCCSWLVLQSRYRCNGYLNIRAYVKPSGVYRALSINALAWCQSQAFAVIGISGVSGIAWTDLALAEGSIDSTGRKSDKLHDRQVNIFLVRNKRVALPMHPYDAPPWNPTVPAICILTIVHTTSTSTGRVTFWPSAQNSSSIVLYIFCWLCIVVSSIVACT